MATSNVTTFYSQLDSSTVTVDGVSPTVYTLTELQQSIDTADLPVRLLLPTLRRGNSAAFRFLAYGHTSAAITWTVTDLMLWTPVNQTSGLRDVALDLVKYSKAYVEMIIDLDLSPNKAVQLVDLQTAIDVFQWPDLAGREYWGVESILTIEELAC